MMLSPEALSIIEEEEKILKDVLSSLHAQMSHGSTRLQVESQRSRELTSRLVAASRDDDKQMLASDEAVSHSLYKAKRSEMRGLKRLIDSPYFARIVLEEERNGTLTEIEYKLGTSSNIDCRIIDWRKAPIARLFYEYKEGEEYSEIIQGKERNGTIKIRNKINIKKGTLLRLSCQLGNFIRKNNEWEEEGAGGHRRSAGSYRQLPDILSLITPQQFDMITNEAETAVFIQGIAGSGKTTVALYRLAWLLHEENSDLQADECVVLVLSSVLKGFVKNSLPDLGIEETRVWRFCDWAARVLSPLGIFSCAESDSPLTLPREQTPPGIARVKQSMALLLALEEFAAQHPIHSKQEYTATVLNLLEQPQRILAHDSTKLLDRELIRQAHNYTRNCWNRGRLDFTDDALFLRVHQLAGGQSTDTTNPKPKFRHIVVDEVQDLSAMELAVVVDAVEETSQLTLVGDTEQESSADPSFPGWDRLRNHWKLGSSVSSFITLTVSHRSPMPIMRLADYVLGKKRTTSGREGKTPLWIKCRSENEGVRQAINWLERVLSRYPDTLVAVICRSPGEARHVLSLLTPSFGSAARIGDEDSFSFAEGILVSDVKQVKGLEFPNVLIWNPSSRRYPAKTNAKKLLYVAITRAEEHLSLVTWKSPSPLLPPIYSRYVRSYEPDAEDQETIRRTHSRHGFRRK